MSVEAYEVGHRSDKRGVNLISYRGPNSLRDAIDYAKFNSRLQDVLIRVYDEAGKRDRNEITDPNHAMLLIAGRKHG